MMIMLILFFSFCLREMDTHLPAYLKAFQQICLIREELHGNIFPATGMNLVLHLLKTKSKQKLSKIKSA